MHNLDLQGRDGRWAPLAAALAESSVGNDLDSSEPDITPAAVLILIYDKDEEPHIVLTRRTSHLAAHKGEISLPGGAYEADKDASLLHTAVREAMEEVGVDGEGIEILGRLPTVYTTSSHYAIAPYVATTTEAPTFRPDPFEVAELLEVPLAVLLDPGVVREEEWEVEGELHIIAFYAYGEHKIWGATHRILNEFFEVLEKVAPNGHPSRS